MSMKKTDLEKNKAIKLREGVQKAPVPTRFGVASTAVPDRREQRRRLGLAEPLHRGVEAQPLGPSEEVALHPVGLEAEAVEGGIGRPEADGAAAGVLLMQVLDDDDDDRPPPPPPPVSP